MTDLFSNQPESFRIESFSINKFDLPDSDITLIKGFLNEIESNSLYEKLYNTIDWRHDKISYFGKIYDLPRLTAWYGEVDKPYTYSGIPMYPKPWTKELLIIKNKIEEISNISFSSVLLNLYRNGNDSVAWHSDDEKELGKNPVIASLSLGETRTFQLRHKYEKDKKENIVLTHGCFLLMKGLTQHYWQHQIPKSSKILRPRINLTFRQIS